MDIPWHCPRKREDCIALSNMVSDDGSTFFCCGENRIEKHVEEDIYTICFKGPFRDDMSFHDKRDLTHQAAVISGAIAIVQADYSEDKDFSPWDNKAPIDN